ncbi:hypothetical protein ACFXPR_15610 [Nocardia tengchongensis]
MTTHLAPQPFDQFVESLTTTDYKTVRTMPGAAVESAHAFEEMRTYLLDL